MNATAAIHFLSEYRTAWFDVLMNEGFERYRRRHIKTYVCHLSFSLGQLPLVPAVPWTIVWSLCLPSSAHLWPRHPLCLGQVSTTTASVRHLVTESTKGHCLPAWTMATAPTLLPPVTVERLRAALCFCLCLPCCAPSSQTEATSGDSFLVHTWLWSRVTRNNKWPLDKDHHCSTYVPFSISEETFTTGAHLEQPKLVIKGTIDPGFDSICIQLPVRSGLGNMISHIGCLILLNKIYINVNIKTSTYQVTILINMTHIIFIHTECETIARIGPGSYKKVWSDESQKSHHNNSQIKINPN